MNDLTPGTKLIHTGTDRINAVTYVADGEYIGGGASRCSVQLKDGVMLYTTVGRLRQPRADEWDRRA